MTPIRSAAAIILVVSGGLMGQTPPAATPANQSIDKAAAYYHFTLAHYYAESLAQNGNRGDVLNKAIEQYKLAIKADPTATFLSEELSDLYIQSGRLREAVSDAEEAIKANPKDIGARRILARLYTRLISDGNQNHINEDMLKKAVEQYQKIAATDPNDIDTLLVLGRLYKVSNNSVDSEKVYKQALALDPNNEDALTGLAVVYGDLGDTKRAADMLRQASDKNPTPRNLFQLAMAYEQLRDYPMASQAMKRAVELNPPNVNEFKRQLGRLQMDADQLNDALATFQALAAEEPNDADSWLQISRIYRMRHDFTKSHEAATKAHSVDPNNIDVRLNDVALLVDEGKTDDAITLLKGMVDQTPKRGSNPQERASRIQLLEKLGLLYRSVDKTNEAVEVFRQISQVDSDLSPKVEALVVETYLLGKDYPKADKESEAAVQKYPDDRNVMRTRALVLSDLGKFDPAIAMTKKLLTGKDDRDTYITLAQLYEKAKRFDDMSKALDDADKLSVSKDDRITTSFMRGSMYERQKKFEQAEEEFRKVLVDDPENASALNYLGYMMADRNSRLNEALDLINRALKKEPGNGAYLDSLGWVYFRMNRLPEAEETLRIALDKMMAKDPTVHDHLGDVYMKEGKVHEAIAQWEGSLHEWESGPPSDLDHSEMAKVQKKLETAKVRLAKETGRQKN